MTEPLRDRHTCTSEAIPYHLNQTSIPEDETQGTSQREIGMYNLGKDRCLYQIVSTAGNYEYIKMRTIPEWVDTCSSVSLHRERLVIVGGDLNRGDKRALILNLADNTQETQLPDLPEPLFNMSAVLLDNEVYVVGGYNVKRGRLFCVYYLSIGCDTWETKQPMSHSAQCPLMIHHQHCIYVLGGYIKYCCQSHVSRYSNADDTWKECSDMPAACSSGDAGVVVHEGRIKVITVEKCLIYDDDTDTWTVKQYNKLGDTLNAFVRKGQIWAVVRRIKTYCVLSYDDVDNAWNTEHQSISNVWHTKLFC